MDKMKLHRWILLALWILSLVIVSFYGGAVSYGLFFCVTLLPAISFLYLIFVYRSFTLYQQIESRNIVAGQPQPYYFVLQNDSFFAFTSVSVKLFSSFSYVEKLPDGIVYELLPGDKFPYETKLVCRYRGEYEVGIKEILITDFFRLFRLRYAVPGTIKALVLPRIIRVKELGSIADIPLLSRQVSAFTQTEPDSTVRNYMDGDALKQIHWKATARRQAFMVRNKTGEEKQSISILCDTKRYYDDMKKYLPVENKILEILLALGFFFAEKNIPFSLYYGQSGMVCHSVKEMNDFDAFYQNTASIQFDKTEDARAILAQAMSTGSFRNNKIVFCILHAWDDSYDSLTAQLVSEGIIVVIYLITEENPEDCLKQNSLRRRLIVLPVDAEPEGRL